MPIDRVLESDAVVQVRKGNEAASLAQAYRRVRAFTQQIVAPLSAEDCVVQTMPEVSPAKWHLAHTTWFFETFLLKQRPDIQPFDPHYESLFNSYYNGIGPAFPREKRGQISRPSLEDTMRYRQSVDEKVLDWINDGELTESQTGVLVLGLNHEQQHQELMLTDIKHVLFNNPGYPAYRELSAPRALSDQSPLGWSFCDETIVEVGCDAAVSDIDGSGQAFAYDNEGPRHRQLIQPHKIASRCVTNGEYLEFINDGGYQNAEFWLSLGWDAVCRNRWEAPMYWISGREGVRQFSLGGLLPLIMDEPVCHVSYFEADAYARWKGKRLPTEFEWERAARSTEFGNVFADRLLSCSEVIHPQATAVNEFLGNVWEWTASPYVPYPGFAAAEGALGEYNGKFMCNQFVLRGGSCATPSDHIRISYRNFFPPETRWQFSGIRLAE